MQGIGFKQDGAELAKLRERLQKMSEAQLLAFGKDAKYMCSPLANYGKPPRECFLVQLRAAKAEWMRRQESGMASSLESNT
jgi:hypothetical protein